MCFVMSSRQFLSMLHSRREVKCLVTDARLGVILSAEMSLDAWLWRFVIGHVVKISTVVNKVR